MAGATEGRARIGIDLGGTKIEGVLLDGKGAEIARRRIPAPRDNYDATLTAIGDLAAALEAESGSTAAPLGLAMPGGISKRTGRVHNANSTWLNGRDLARDLAIVFAARGQERVIAIANDANCFALSEATDGAAAGAGTVFGVILGTGTGGGIAIGGRVLDGPLGIAGEWGHNPLPWAGTDETPGPACWCGRLGCMETWVSGPGLASDHMRVTGQSLSAEQIAAAAEAGDIKARATLAKHAERLARGLAHVVNIIDPDVIVLGGGLSKLSHLYDVLPALMRPSIFADDPDIDIRPPKWGDASGVRGAAWLTNGAA